MGHFEKCKYAESCGYEFCPCEECIDFEAKVMTNADRIRAMTDEELAQYLVSVESRRRGDGCGAIWGLPYVALDWLKQPAEVE